MNKKNWHKKLINALWVDKVSIKKSIGMSHFQLVYKVDTIFPSSLVIPIMKILEEMNNETNDMQRRINQMIHLQQTREEVYQNNSKLQGRIKKIYDSKTKEDNFNLGDVVLRWHVRNEEKGKHAKFENLWKGPYKILAFGGKNAFLLEELNGEYYLGGVINGMILKHYHT